MKYKLIASDFDGTLLKDDFSISENTLKTIKKYQNAGGIFTVATGRSFETVEPYLGQLGLDKVSVPLVVNMGANIVDSVTRKSIHSECIERQRAIEYAALLDENKLIYLVSTNEGSLIDCLNEIMSDYVKYLDVDYKLTGKISDYLKNNDVKCYKFLVFITDYQYDNIYKDIQNRFSDLFTVRSTAPLLKLLNIDGQSVSLMENVSGNANKGEALRFVAKKLGIDIKQTMAIGDSYNDMAMLKVAGLGVAMKNAQQALIDAAHFVTKSNNDDGVAEAINTKIFVED